MMFIFFTWLIYVMSIITAYFYNHQIQYNEFIFLMVFPHAFFLIGGIIMPIIHTPHNQNNRGKYD